MKNIKRKLFFALIALLLFLITWANEAKAATYQENSRLIVRGLNENIGRPVADLIIYTGNCLAWPYKSFYLPPKFVKTALGDLNHLGMVFSNSAGKLFAQTGNLLAIMPHNLPKVQTVGASTARVLAKAMSPFKNWGKIFEVSGRALAIVPNNLPDLLEVNADVGNFLINAEKRVQGSVMITLAFFNETVNNLTNNPPKEFYPQTQKLITSAKNNLDNNFYQINFNNQNK